MIMLKIRMMRGFLQQSISLFEGRTLCLVLLELSQLLILRLMF